jgi:hypothetical protein
VDLAGSTAAFYRLLATFHRKQIGFSSLMFLNSRVIVVLSGEVSSLDVVVGAVKRETTVVNVEVLEGMSIAAEVDRLLCRG